MKLAFNFLRDESGATAIEYGIIVAIVGTGLLTTLQSLNGSVVTFYDRFIAAITDVVE